MRDWKAWILGHSSVMRKLVERWVRAAEWKDMTSDYIRNRHRSIFSRATGSGA